MTNSARNRTVTKFVDDWDELKAGKRGKILKILNVSGTILPLYMLRGKRITLMLWRQQIEASSSMKENLTRKHCKQNWNYQGIGTQR